MRELVVVVRRGVSSGGSEERRGVSGCSEEGVSGSSEERS